MRSNSPIISSYPSSRSNYEQKSDDGIPKELGGTFPRTCEYKQVHGNCIISKHNKANKQLGVWVSTQRIKEETVSEERRKRLNSIGFVWKLRATPILVDWEVRFQQLVEYKRVYGNCNVPQHYQPNPQLRTWVMNQRTRKETMSENKRNQLNSIGFVWKFRATPIYVDWGVLFQQLMEYKRVHSNCNVWTHDKANKQLGRWVSNQRTNKEESIRFHWVCLALDSSTTEAATTS